MYNEQLPSTDFYSRRELYYTLFICDYFSCVVFCIGLNMYFLLLKIIHLKSLICIFGGLSEDFLLEFYKNFMKTSVRGLFWLNNFPNQHFLVILLYKSRFLGPQGPFSFRGRHRGVGPP